MSITEDFFSIIDTEIKAYLLGNIAAGDPVCNKYPDGMIFIVNMLTQKKKVPLVMACDICRNLQIFFEESSNSISLPETKDPDIKWAFIRGFFDSKGYIVEEKCECGIKINSKKLKNDIANFSEISCEITDESIVFKLTNALDFLSKLYDKSLPGFRNTEFLAKYYNILGYTDLLKLKVYKTVPNAFLPQKNRCSDEGYDIHLISIDKVINENTVRYDTGIKVEPPLGWHVEILPRSSLSNLGFILTNSVGLIDANYRGTLKVVLTNIGNKVKNLPLPNKAVQIVLKRNAHFVCIESEVDNTERGEKGFGSTK